MQLLSLKMKNYRRFDKETTIDFAAGDKNVTIIRAENGAGKTGNFDGPAFWIVWNSQIRAVPNC